MPLSPQTQMISVLSNRSELFDRFDDAADLVVGVGHVGRPDVDLAKIELLLVSVQRVPLRQEVGPGRQLRVGRHDAELLLVLEDAFGDRVPAVVEETHRADLLDPFRRRMMRRVSRARRVVDEPRPLRIGRRLRADVLDALVRERGVEVPARLAVVGMDRRHVAEEVARLPLARVAADEAVEIVVALPDRPMVERPLRARLPAGHIVVLAEPGGRVAVLLERLRAVRGLGPGDRVVAGIAGRGFGDHAEADPVMVAAGEQRRPRRRAERRIVHLGVAQAALSRACRASGSARRRRMREFEPKPASSMRTSSTFGAPSGGIAVGGQAGWLLIRFGSMKPLNGGVGVGSTVESGKTVAVADCACGLFGQRDSECAEQRRLGRREKELPSVHSQPPGFSLSLAPGCSRGRYRGP